MMTSKNTGSVHPQVTSRTVALGGFLLLFVVSRLLYLVLIDPNYLLIFSAEGLYCGTIAQELVTGLTLPSTDYRINNYAGGSLVIGIVAAGFFLLFGPTLFALNLAPLLLFTLTLAFWYRTLQQYASERVAGYFSMLFCFSPPLFTAYSVTAVGHHSESIFFSAVAVFLLFRMLSQERPSPAYPMLLGLISGVGLWFAYIYGLTLLAVLSFWLWHDKGALQRLRVLWFALGFGVGFAPWIIINVQTHFAGLVIYGINVWEHFGLMHLLDRLVDPRQLAPVQFLARLASDNGWDLYRRAANLLYSLLFLGPILTAGLLRQRAGLAAPAGARPTRPTLVGFAILYLVLFTLAVQFSDFKGVQYNLPAYPFLFFFAALSVARCEDLFLRVQRQIHAAFLTSVIVVGLVTHAPLLSLDRPGEALFAKGYSYGLMPEYYVSTHAPADMGDRNFIIEVVQRPFLSDILPKLSSDDQQDLSRAIAQLLAAAVPSNGQADDFARVEQLVPAGFERHFYFQVGVMAMDRHPNELPEGVATVEFVRHRSAEAHHLALVGIYRQWPRDPFLDTTRESLANATAPTAPDLSRHYWRALGYWTGRYWYEKDRSLSLLNAHLQSFVPGLDLTVQSYFLQGVGELLFTRLIDTPWVAPAELERFPQAYQSSLLEGWGMALGEFDHFSEFPWHGYEGPLWMASTKGLSAGSLASVQHGKAQFDALFEGPVSSALKPPRNAR
jgi:4-amino-4-deoxy-L-arabinose transferase-like glycosyltransferase